jgi:hypothetical protein
MREDDLKRIIRKLILEADIVPFSNRGAQQRPVSSSRLDMEGDVVNFPNRGIKLPTTSNVNDLRKAFEDAKKEIVALDKKLTSNINLLIFDANQQIESSLDVMKSGERSEFNNISAEVIQTIIDQLVQVTSTCTSMLDTASVLQGNLEELIETLDPGLSGPLE